MSGKAGNLNGNKIDGGNVFEAPRRREYPLPLKTAYAPAIFPLQDDELVPTSTGDPLEAFERG